MFFVKISSLVWAGNLNFGVIYPEIIVPQNSTTKMNTVGLTKTSTATGALYYVNRVDIVVQERP